MFFIEKVRKSSSHPNQKSVYVDVEYTDDMSDDDENNNKRNNKKKKKTSCPQYLKDSNSYLLSVMPVNYPFEFEVGLYGLQMDAVSVRSLRMWFQTCVTAEGGGGPMQVRCEIGRAHV